MPSDNTVNISATPRRTTPMQALSSLFRTPTHLRTPGTVNRRSKRSRPRTSSLPSPASPTPSSPSLPAVVLQTYSTSTDSIVLTALPSAPFCCHEDLLTMSRAQLEAVVRALNARLPRRMWIGPEDDFWQSDGHDGNSECNNKDDGLLRMSEAEMRRRVEELVGIRAVAGKHRVSKSGPGLDTRTGVPPAPKAMRIRDATWRPSEKTPWEMEMDTGEDQSDDSSIMSEDALVGSSPLASRIKLGLHVRGQGNTLPRLAILQEENEGDDSKEDASGDNETRPSKRQRVSLMDDALDSKGGSQIVREVGKSRMIENMVLSGSPLLAKDDAPLRSYLERNSTMGPTTTNPGGANRTPEKMIQVSLQRRSARIKEMALKRKSSFDKATFNARGLESSILRSRALLSPHPSNANPALLAGSDARKDPVPPEALTIRLPFASTPPQAKPDSSAWSARILRSHSQRVLDSSQSMKTKVPLGRSQSERYPRTSDSVFVTMNRPRYRFARRKSKSTKPTNRDQVSHPSSPTPLEQSTRQLRWANQTGARHCNGTREYDKENKAPSITTKHSAVAEPHTLPLTLCGFLTPRTRAPSTSTVASTQGDCGDPPALTAKEGIAPTATTVPMVMEFATDCVLETLGRMVVDSA